MAFTASRPQIHTDFVFHVSYTTLGQTEACLASGNPNSQRATSDIKIKRGRGSGGEEDSERVRDSDAKIRSETIDLSAEAECFHQVPELVGKGASTCSHADIHTPSQYESR